MNLGDTFMFIKQISATKRDTYRRCKLRFYLRYYERLPGQPQNQEALNYGSYIHKVFEKGIDSKNLKELNEISEQYKKSYKVSYRRQDKIEKSLENFLKFKESLNKVVSTEKSFEVEIADGMFHVGIIDLIVEGKDGGYLIVDYKTSKSRKSKYDLRKDGQLMSYCLAVHKLYDVPIHKITCAHYYPEPGKLVPVTFTKPQIINHVREIVKDMWAIRKKKKNEFPAEQNEFCNWCEYEDCCPVFVNASTLKARIDEHKALKKTKK